jgi:hypothetical protein
VQYWRGYKCEGKGYFFYFSMTGCSLIFCFKGSDCREAILFAKHTLFRSTFVSLSITVTNTKYEIVWWPLKGCFQDLASLMRCSECLTPCQDE